MEKYETIFFGCGKKDDACTPVSCTALAGSVVTKMRERGYTGNKLFESLRTGFLYKEGGKGEAQLEVCKGTKMSKRIEDGSGICILKLYVESPTAKQDIEEVKKTVEEWKKAFRMGPEKAKA
ncbi:MAG: hypothetical protein ACE5J7_04850 [Candidatus Aenigmatarchaeota archaeon]